MIGKLREEVDVIKAESLKWKGNMDSFAAEKEAARAQLSSAKSRLQSLKEKSLVQVRKTEELEARLASKLAKAKKTKDDADAFVAVYRADAEVAQSHAREIHARGFYLTEEITTARKLEADDGALASDDDDDDDDDDDGSKSGSKSGDEPDEEKTAP
uniref:Zinc finger CCCH domain-containing protein 15 homolog n=1 Tax=Nicotiana tabacum TaxID=4097 RepID=A0A1S4CPN1_TOBAC